MEQTRGRSAAVTRHPFAAAIANRDHRASAREGSVASTQPKTSKRSAVGADSAMSFEYSRGLQVI
jgi:hypothetical protein